MASMSFLKAVFCGPAHGHILSLRSNSLTGADSSRRRGENLAS